jgi:hypothetical protein
MHDGAQLMAKAAGLSAIWLDVAPEHDDEFNAWYKYEHLQQMVEKDGYLSGRRYIADHLYPKYLALYETVGDTTTVTTPARTPWQFRMVTLFGENRRRCDYQRLSYAVGSGDPYGSVIFMIQGDAAAGKDSEVLSWLKQNAKLGLGIPGCTSVRYYVATAGQPQYLELYEFADESSLASAQWYRFLSGDERRPLASTLVNVIQQRYRSISAPYLRTE